MQKERDGSGISANVLSDEESNIVKVHGLEEKERMKNKERVEENKKRKTERKKEKRRR